jgi:hypothetical protein
MRRRSVQGTGPPSMMDIVSGSSDSDGTLTSDGDLPDGFDGGGGGGGGGRGAGGRGRYDEPATAPPDYGLVFLNHVRASSRQVIEGIRWDHATLSSRSGEKLRPEFMYDRNRRKCVAALRRVGLRVEQVISISRDEVIVRLWAPDWAVERHAERIKYRAQLRPVPSILRPGELEDAGFAVFRVANRDRFLPFKSAERLRIIRELIRGERRTGAAGVDVDEMIEARKMEDFFPCHDPAKVDILMRGWARPFFAPQPLQAVRDYFNEQVALYFAFAGFVTQWLVFPAVLGVAVFIFGIARGDFDNVLVPVYCLSITIWSSLFVVYWRRQSAGIAFNWGMREYKRSQKTRPGFQGEVRAGFYSGTSFIPLNEADYLPEERAALPRDRYQPGWQRQLRTAVGLGVLAVSVALALLATFALLFVQFRLAQALDPAPDSPGARWGTVIGGFVIGCSISIGNIAFKLVAVRVNEWENYRTADAAEWHLVLKVFVFQAVNSYSSLFYVAFLKESFSLFGVHDRCVPNCMEELVYQITTILVTTQAMNLALEVIGPLVMTKLRTARKDRAVRSLRAAAREGGAPVPRFTFVEKQAKLEPFDGVLFEYMSKIIVMGQIALFSGAFTLAPALALLYNLIEIRTDAYKLLRATRRPQYEGAAGIGPFMSLLRGVSYAAILTNAALIAWTSVQLQSYLPGLSPQGRLLAVVFIEHIVVLLNVFVEQMVPLTPTYIARATARQAFQQEFHGLKDSAAGQVYVDSDSDTASELIQEAEEDSNDEEEEANREAGILGKDGGALR